VRDAEDMLRCCGNPKPNVRLSLNGVTEPMVDEHQQKSYTCWLENISTDVKDHREETIFYCCCGKCADARL
jgi:hypothetical protein